MAKSSSSSRRLGYALATVLFFSIASFSVLLLIAQEMNEDSTSTAKKMDGWVPVDSSFNSKSRELDGSNSSNKTSHSNNTVIHPLDALKVPHPIFVASLPKSGTTTIARYFYCGKIWTAHTFCNTNETADPSTETLVHKKKQLRIGHCFLNNLQAHRPLLQDCGRYKVWSDAGHARGTPCFYPSVHGLEALYQDYPTATILLVTRNSTAWAKSVGRWKHGELVQKWSRCEHFPVVTKERLLHNLSSVERDLKTFYEWHIQHLRTFAKQHASTMTYIELSLEDEDLGQQLEASIGIRAECLGHHNSHEKRLQVNPTFRRQYEEGQAKLQKEREAAIAKRRNG